jgi:hypothetical protein
VRIPLGLFGRGVMGVDFCLFATGVHFSSGVTSLAKLASQEVERVTHFEWAQSIGISHG